MEVATGIEPVYTALQAVASPLGHTTRCEVDSRRADDGIRTRAPHLGKVMRYQLRYIRMPTSDLVDLAARGAKRNLRDRFRTLQIGRSDARRTANSQRVIPGGRRIGRL